MQTELTQTSAKTKYIFSTDLFSARASNIGFNSNKQKITSWQNISLKGQT